MVQFIQEVQGKPVVQAIQVAKLTGITNLLQFLRCNNIDAIKEGYGGGALWYMTIRGVVEALIRRNFGGNAEAAALFYSMEDKSDQERVVAVLELLESRNPGCLELKKAGPKFKGGRTRNVKRKKLELSKPSVA